MTKEEIIDLFEYFLRDMRCLTKYKKCLKENYKFYLGNCAPGIFISSAFMWYDSLNNNYADTMYWKNIDDQWIEVLKEKEIEINGFSGNI